MHRFGTGRRLATSALSWLCLAVMPPALAGPVWITAGNQEGQGFAFSLGNDCYVYTAGHVVAGAKDTVTLVDPDAYRASGKVLKIDARLDLALIEVPSGTGDHRRLCASGNLDAMLQLDSLLPTIRKERRDVWMDRVDSLAGGLDRIELLQGSQASLDTLDVVAKPATASSRGGRLPLKGDSGSSVWVSERTATERYRYTRKGELVPRPPGSLLGVLVAIEGKSARIVRSDRVYEFIFNTLQPIERSAIAIRPSSAKVTEFRRGPFPRRGSEQMLPVSAKALNALAVELDLGSADTVVTGVALLFADGGGVADRGRRPGRAAFATVESSQFQPVDSQKWVAEPCRPDAKSRAGGRDTRVACDLLRPRVARGLRIEISADTSKLRGIEVITEN